MSTDTTFDILETISELAQKTFVGTDGNHQKVRENALGKFTSKGLPTKKDEEYKYTPVQTWVNKKFDSIHVKPDTQLGRDEVEQHLYDHKGHHLVFVNGKFEAGLSTTIDDENLKIEESDDVTVLNQIASADDVFVAINTAFTESYVKLDVSGQAQPVFIYHVIDNRDQNILVNPRISVTSGTSSEIRILEKTISLGEKQAWINKVIEADVKQNASFNYTVVQSNASHLLETHGLKARQFKDSRFYANTFSFKGGLIRNNLNVSQEDQNCETHMHGLYLIDGKSHVDNHTSVDHKKANSYSNEVYKGIVDGSAHAVFNGKIFVRQDAQQTNAFQSNSNISLSESATINTKPQLEIWADDVKCSHGCTIGQLDEDAVYYLRTRGIDQKSAKAMLLVAFAEEAFEYIPFDFLKEELHTKINQRLSL